MCQELGRRSACQVSWINFSHRQSHPLKLMIVSDQCHGYRMSPSSLSFISKLSSTFLTMSVSSISLSSSFGRGCVRERRARYVCGRALCAKNLLPSEEDLHPTEHKSAQRHHNSGDNIEITLRDAKLCICCISCVQPRETDLWRRCQSDVYRTFCLCHSYDHEQLLSKGETFSWHKISSTTL